MTETPKVSVPIITYNQVNYIGEAIESVLAQKTSFQFEILVGDDFSTDGTREVILQYAEKYPDIIIPVLHPRNMGKNGLLNTLETYKLARGKYIASMDGDDYWTSPDKIQKQADFLDRHEDFTICYHNALITYHDGSPSELVNPETQPAVSQLEDLIGEDEVWFMATSSVMFRNHVITQYPGWFYESSSGDIPRYILLAMHGRIGYLPETMSVYRKNRNGSSFADNYRDAGFLTNRIGMYSGINRELGYRFDKILKKNIGRYYRMLLESNQYRDSYYRRVPVALSYLRLSRPPWAETKEILKEHVIPPPLMRLYSAIALLPYRLKGS